MSGYSPIHKKTITKIKCACTTKQINVYWTENVTNEQFLSTYS